MVFPTSGSQFGSGNVSGLIPVLAFRVAVTGRQKFGIAFGVVEGDHRVGDRKVKQGKESGALCGCEAMHQDSGLGDLVPIVLNSSIPESRRLTPGQPSWRSCW